MDGADAGEVIVLDNGEAVVPWIVERHVEEAAFLWEQRAGAVDAPHHTLATIARLDERLDAHLDGLALAGAAAWPAIDSSLETGELGESFVAVSAALSIGEIARLNALLDAAEASPGRQRATIAAFGWAEPEMIRDPLARLLADPSPWRRAVAIATCAMHRVDAGAALGAALAHGHPALRRRALAAAGVLRRRDLLERVHRALNDDDPECRLRAAVAATLLGSAPAAMMLAQLVEANAAPAWKILPLLLRSMPPGAAMHWLQKLAEDPARQRDVVLGAGVIGVPAYVPWLIRLMEDPALARPAADAFSAITGLELEHEPYRAPAAPAGFSAGPTDDPEDEDVAPDPDADLPWPIPAAIAAWWAASKGRFQEGTRYMGGRPISPPALQHVLMHGRQRHRVGAALELALRVPTAPLFPTKAPAAWQRRVLETYPR